MAQHLTDGFVDKHIYQLKAHEACFLRENCVALRVPGGWIYFVVPPHGDCREAMTSTFVPYSEEFKP